MRAVDLIDTKRRGAGLEPEAIDWLIRQYVRDRVPDYQIAAWLMAVCLNGLDERETIALTKAMIDSGEVFDFSDLGHAVVDKHSTGGVGDKVSLVLAPLAAASGLYVPMVAGRGLGHTGGTLDKLEAIPGFRTERTGRRMRRQLEHVGVVIMGQTRRFVPADRKMYALRDVTATVESIPLIAASIMSKKLAEGCRGLVLDVKVGNGAFMPDRKNARKLARTMIDIGRSMNRTVEAVLTDMNRPLGRAVGNANETAEAIACLKGQGPGDLRRLSLALTERMLLMGGLARNPKAAAELAANTLDSGAALEKFAQWVGAQGGDPAVIDQPEHRLPSAPNRASVLAPTDGWITHMDTRRVGWAAMTLGAGRRTRDDRIDPGVGLWVEAGPGDRVEAGQPVFTVAWRRRVAWRAARPMLERAFTIGPRPGRNRPLLLERIAGASNLRDEPITEIAPSGGDA